MYVKELGSSIWVKEWHEEKAEDSISVTFSGITICVNELQPPKVYGLIDVTVDGIVI